MIRFMFNALLILNTTLLSGSNKPNIVLIIADDLGWNDLGCYGNENVSTPNIDRLAKEGLKFNNTYLTTSSCSPSRSSIISGRFPHNTGFPEFTYKGALAKNISTFPLLLKEAGYYTAQSGKWHLGDNPRKSFDKINDKEIGPGGESDWIHTIKNRPKNRPFFMWFASTDPHRTWGKNAFAGTHKADKIQPPPFLADTKSTREDLAKYYDEITRFDHYIGEVEEELKAQGVLDNTVLLILSDNGRPFPRCKTRLYDSGIKTPLVIKWEKGIKMMGEECNAMVSAIDIAPTILDIAGIDIPASFQGKSFKSLFNNPTLEFRKYIFAEHNWHGFETYERMVRTKNFMYIINKRPSLSNPPPSDAIKSPSFKDLIFLKNNGQLSSTQNDIFINPRPREELYNCIKDSLQLFNIASLASYKKELKTLRKIMKKWQKATDDSLPDHLTPDWYDRSTGMLLQNIEHKPGEIPKGIRGTKPGGPQAITVTSGGPF